MWQKQFTETNVDRGALFMLMRDTVVQTSTEDFCGTAKHRESVQTKLSVRKREVNTCCQKNPIDKTWLHLPYCRYAIAVKKEVKYLEERIYANETGETEYPKS